MKKILAAATLAVLGATAAQAADLATRPAYTKAPVAVEQVYSWTGFYVGGELGGRWSKSTWTTDALQDPINPLSNFRLPQGNPAGFDSASVRAGGYFGYNWQVAPTWVLGIEGDAAWGDNKKSLAGIPGTWPAGTAPATIALDGSSIKLGWDAAIRGKVGYLVTPSVMLFGTGGVAWQNIQVNANCQPGGGWACGAVRNTTFETNKAGWTAGGGIEAKVMTNWLARVEYRYADFGRTDYLFFPVTADGVRMHHDLQTHTVSVGLAYQFGGPVVARY
jgi:outer membrane immunogenic protein